MGEQRNLTEENVEGLTALLDKMREPQQPDGISSEHRILLEKLEAIERKLDMIFGSNVLINGKFLNIAEQQTKK